MRKPFPAGLRCFAHGPFATPGRRLSLGGRNFLRRLPLWRRFLLIGMLLPFVLAGGASGAYYLRLHRVSSTLSLEGLPVAPRPDVVRRILVIAPHCDDETLGVGGLIADARQAGAEVTVVFLTNGDGFPLAAGRALRDLHLAPNDYIRFATRRQGESLAALSTLGVAPDQVQFLGYPDRGLAPLWEKHWQSDRPYRSRYTGHTRSPYLHAYTRHAVHSGASLFSDLCGLVQATQPTDIYVTHPADDHPDHSAAAAFTQAALLWAQDKGASWAQRARLRYYLVHRGDWPLPQGSHPRKPLLPPAGLVALDTRWEVYPLSHRAQNAKRRALERYRSQMAVMGRFLSSFVRENELYGSLPDLHARANEHRAAVAQDPLRDNVVRYAGPSADLRGLSVEQEERALRVRITLCGRVSSRVRYTLLLRAMEPGIRSDARNTRTRFLALKLPVQRERQVAGRPAANVVTHANTIEAIVPLADLDLSTALRGRRVWVAAQTHWARMPVDQTGFRPFTLTK